MKISGVTLENFGLHRSLKLDFTEPITMIVGDPDSGKSTVKDAISYAFRGLCRGLDGRGGGFEDLVTDGEDPASMAVVVETSNGVITRKTGEGPLTKAGQVIAGKVGIDPALLELCMEWETILTANDRDAKRILLACLGVNLTGHTIKQIVGEENYLAIGDLIVDGDLDSVRRAYNAMYTRRKEIGKEIKGYKPADFSTFHEKIRNLSAKAAQKTLESVQRQLRALEEELASKAGAQTTLAAERGALTSRLRDKEPLLARAESLWNVWASSAALRDVRIEASNKATQAHESAARRMDKIVEDVAKVKADAEQSEEAIHALRTKTAKGQCPTCYSKITAAHVEKVAKALSDKVTAAKAEMSKLTSEKITLTGEIAEKRQAARAAEEAFKESHNAMLSMSGEKAPLEKLRAEVAELKAQLAALPAGEEAVREDSTLGDLRKRIANGNALVAELPRYIIMRNTAEREQIDHQNAQKQHEAAEKLVALLAPKGQVYTDLIATKIEPFEKRLNAILEPMGYQMKIELDPFDIKAAKLGRKFTSARTNGRLASSARLRLALALQSAVAIHTGLGIVLLDDVDRIPSTHQARLAKSMLQALNAGVEQIIAFGMLSRNVDDFQPPKVRNFDFKVFRAPAAEVAA